MQSKNGKKQEEDEGHLIVVILLLKKVVAEPLLSLFFFRLGADWILLKSTHVFFFVFFVVWKLTVVSRTGRRSGCAHTFHLKTRHEFRRGEPRWQHATNKEETLKKEIATC